MFKRKVGRPSKKSIRRRNTVKLVSIITVFILFGFLFYQAVNVLPNNINKLKADVNGISGAVFDEGKEVNSKMKKLSGQTDAEYSTENTTITSIQRSNSLSITPTEENIVSAPTSDVPIYMWYDNGTIYWYTSESKPKLNPDSSYMFKSFTSLANINLSDFDTSNVTNMTSMFAVCTSLTSLDVSNFNTSKVTNMNSMFENCSSLTSLDLSSFNTSNVTSMRSLFNYCSSLSTLNISSFNTSKVTDMFQMFCECENLTSLDLSHFDTSNVFGMDNMFFYCNNLTTLNISSFDTSKVQFMIAMFYGCEKLTYLDLSHFDTSNVRNMRSMFSLCSSLTTLNISSFDTSNVIDMRQMFSSCNNLTNLDLRNFDTSKVTNMEKMFSSCNNLTNLDLSSFDTSSVTNMSDMFYECEKLMTLDLSSFDTSKVTNMNSMFRNWRPEEGTSLTTIYVSNKWNTDSVTTSSNMFNGLYNIVGGAGTAYDENHVDKEYARIDTSSTPGYFTLKGSEEPITPSDDPSNIPSNTTPSNTTPSNTSECKYIITSSVYTIDNDKLTINNVEKDHSAETIRSNISSDCGKLMVSEDKVILSSDNVLKEYKINRMWIPKTGQKIIKYAAIFMGIIVIIAGLLIYKKKNDK